jgi:glycosyltransferase involved in cell wall biosynthesis
MTAKAPILIALPSGLTIGGVQVWAARLANALANRDRRVGLILHPPKGAMLRVDLDARIQIFNLPAIPEAASDLTRFLPHYERAVSDLHAATGQPVVCVPNHLGDCYGLFASLALSHAKKLRVVGWCHSAIPYDARVLDYYEPLLTHFVAVSDHLETRLKQRLPARAADIRNIPCGIETAPEDQAATRRPQPTLRLCYVGRLEDDVKRVSVLPLLSEELTRRGIRHKMTVIGDGPAAHIFGGAPAPTSVENANPENAAPLAETTTETPSRITHIKNAGPARITKLLDEHDIFVLPSRVEGLSVALLEAMSRGCVPIVTRTDSGAAQVIDGRNGSIVDCPPNAAFDQIAEYLADAITSALPHLPEMSRAARRTVENRFSLDRHADAAERLIDAAARSSARLWPEGRQPLFTSKCPVNGSGSVPPDGPQRMQRTLRNLAGHRIILHGAGQHTRELAYLLTSFPNIIALTDDDPARHGESFCGLKIVPPAEAKKTGATDVVISSWMNQDLIWNARAVYESQNLRVHRIYPKAA